VCGGGGGVGAGKGGEGEGDVCERRKAGEKRETEHWKREKIGRKQSQLTCFDSSATSPILRPMKRLTDAKVFSGLTTAWRLAICVLFPVSSFDWREKRKR
jgi:hypothetical protein